MNTTVFFLLSINLDATQEGKVNKSGQSEKCGLSKRLQGRLGRHAHNLLTGMLERH